MEEIFTEELILSIFQKTGALLKGHFKLSSGLHSDTYLQCAKVIQYPQYNLILSSLIASKFRDKNIDVVIGPAIGGIIIAYEVAKQLGARALFAERDAEKKMTLRRGFELKENERVLIVEDVITTGASVREIIKIVHDLKAQLIGIAAFVNRSDKKLSLAENQYFILNINAPKYKEDECPLCKNNKPYTTPGSKYIIKDI